MKRLKWIGPEGEFLPGIPASDFDCQDEKQAEELVKAGLYEYAEKPKKDKDAAPAEGGES